MLTTPAASKPCWIITDLLREEYTGVFRVIPTWALSDSSSLALGLSGMVGRMDDERPGSSDDTVAAWAVDLTYTNGPFKIFGELMQNFGTIHPARYVSGGPSDRITDFLVGASYRTGPVIWRVNYSAGYDDSPVGDQYLFLPGATIALTKNIDLYLEYVKWEVDPDNAPKAEYEDGLQFIINWRF